MLENTRREFGGVGWPGCGVVDIALEYGEVGGSSSHKIRGRRMQESVNGLTKLSTLFQLSTPFPRVACGQEGIGIG